ncbi:MAG: exodeoxyribonuclease VII small subunit [Acidobacteria bacterium]|nr:exodeoxyribonuclease VII small subunit [Acidobacteriota bacterium]
MAKQTEPAAVPFEQSLSELEGVVKELEKPDVPLEKAIELFEKGVRMSEACRKQLAEAETRIEMLVKKGEKVEAGPFDAEE